MNLLQQAAAEGKLDFFNLIIVQGEMDVEKAEEISRLPLNCSLENNHENIVFYLLHKYK